jgi:hypothetical protein
MAVEANIARLRILHLAAAKASDEVGQYLFGFLNTEVARALRSTIIRFDKIPTTEAERNVLLTEALSAGVAAVEKVVTDVAQRLQPQQVGPFRDKALVDTEAAVRKIIMKVFPLVAVQPVAPQPLGLPPRLTQPEIEAIVDIPKAQLRRVGGGGFGDTYKVVYGGKTYLRKDIKFHGDKFMKWSFDTEVKYLELVCSHPLYSMIPLTPYYFGSMIRGDTGYIIEELFSGADLDKVLNNRFVTQEEADFIEDVLKFYVTDFFHDKLKILHLDLKPQNIFVRMHENKIVSVHLLDLGLTRAIGEEGYISGTRAFMSPAQLAARNSGLRKIKHVPEFNTHALNLITKYVQGSIAPPDAIREINTKALVPRAWEENIAASITNALCLVAVTGAETIISSLLSIPGADINKLSADGNTPLLVALANRRKATASYFINIGADVNLRNPRGATPLHWAASNNLTNILNLILIKGADKDALTFTTDPWEPLATPLHWACKAGAPDTAMALLTAGANLGLRDGNGQSTLDLAQLKPAMSSFVKMLEAYKERTGANMGGRRKSPRQRKNAYKTRRQTKKKRY